MLSQQLISDVIVSNSAAGAASELMAANMARARNNFGDSADNMTALVTYFLPRPSTINGAATAAAATGVNSRPVSAEYPCVTSAAGPPSAGVNRNSGAFS